MPKATGIIGFSFQEIPLEEALNVVLAGDGNYSEIKQTLLEKLPTLASDKAFAFGLPGGKEIEEKSRRGLCMSINATLRKAKLNWKITYSGIRKMFICIPKIAIAPNGLKYNDPILDQKILALRAQGFGPRQIAKRIPNALQRAKYLIYETGADTKNKSTSPTNATQLVEIARRVFNYTGNFKNGHSQIIRKAISVVGLNDLGLHPKELAPFIGIGPAGVYFNAKMSKSTRGMKEIETLKKAVKQEG